MIPARRLAGRAGTDLKKFHVLTMISNPVRYESRYELYERFAAHMAASGVTLWTCEIAFGDRPFQVTHAGNHHHLQLRTRTELWHKENALNLLAQRLPFDWQYLAWIDADIQFSSPTWVRETVEALQHYQVVQLFSHAIDLGPSGEHLQTHQSFCYAYVEGRPRGKGYAHWHPGYAWACRREAWDNMGASMGGGLIDFAILGAGDHHMALALINEVETSVPGAATVPYKRALSAWQERAERYVRRDIGYVPGTVLHAWHGKKANRRYGERWSILVDNAYDPLKDIDRDYQGLFRLYDAGDVRSIALRDQIRHYFRSRAEDGIEV